ncbi:MAG: glycosyltransferase [Candidatus Saccharimonadia bacterium]
MQSTKPSSKRIDLSIIIPAYNEAEILPATIASLNGWLGSHHYGEVEVLVIAQSGDLAELAGKQTLPAAANYRVINLHTRAGKGGAVRVGMFEAHGKYRLFMDCDLATPLNHLDEVAQFMARGGQVTIAVRNLARTHHGARKLISGFGNLLTKLLIAPSISDTQCGFKVFGEAEAIEIFGRQSLTGWAFDMEIIFIARKLGYKIETFPVNDWYDPKPTGLVGDSALKAAIASVRDLLRIRLRSLRGGYRMPSFVYHPTKS